MQDHDSSASASSPALHAGIGAIQGLALWSLHESVHGDWWPPGSAPWVWALAYALLVGPLAWQLLPGVFAEESRRIGCAVALGLAFALLGAHAGRQVDDYVFTNGAYVPIACVLAFVVIGLIAGWNRETRRLDYARHFEAGWRNALLIPLAAALTGLLWGLLYAGGYLMEAIGLHGLLEILEKRFTGYLVSATSFSWVLGMGLARPATLLAIRRFVLALVTWLLPLAMVLAVCWVIALPFKGVDTLFATRHAANYLFWFALLSVGFVNAAFQDGRETLPFAPRLARGLALAWLCLPLLMVLADWALWLRVAQYGWTGDRIWAALIAVLLTVYSFGYAASVVFRGAWMSCIPRTNWLTCFLGLAMTVCLISPIADAGRVAVDSQLARLDRGEVTVANFDWLALQRQGRYGRDALKAQSKIEGERGHFAQAALRQIESQQRTWEPLTETTLRANLDVLSADQTLDPRLLSYLVGKLGWEVQECRSTAPRCFVTRMDLDGDEQAEVLLFIPVDPVRRALAVQVKAHAGRASDNTAEAPASEETQILILGLENAQWQRLSDITDKKHDLNEWREAIQKAQLKTLPKRWPDLQINGERVETR